MKKMQEKMLKAFSKAANSMAEKEPREWPPKCYIITYQAARPYCANENKVNKENK